MRENIRQEGFDLKTETGGIAPFVYDSEIIIRILINLIENSLKFGKNAALREIAITVRQEARHVVIRVSDTGPGIPWYAKKGV